MNSRFDVVVIGAGPAGYALSIRLGQRGQRVACIERQAVGGVCLNWGCIPSKALITTARRFDWARHRAAEMGVLTGKLELDLPRAQARNREIVKHHTGGVTGLLRSNGAELVTGAAELLSPRRVRVTRTDGSALELEAARAIVVATGASPRALPGFDPDGQHILTAREAVFLEQLPEHLIVLGGGVIGMELGSAYQQLGARLTIVELAGSLLPGVDPELVQVARRHLERRGATILTDTRALGWQRHGGGVRVEVSGPGGPGWIEGSAVLVAAGFRPNSAGLGLAELGVELDAQGHIAINPRCESSIAGLYAIGDVSGPPYLAHKAYKQAEVLAELLSGQRVALDWQAMPNVIFCDPEIATVGATEARARSENKDVLIGRFPFAALGRAQALGETDGFVKLIATPNRLIGAGVVGPEASELIAELTLAIEVGASLEDLALTVHSHPTLAEAVHEAAEQGLGQAVHILNRRKPARAAATVGAEL